MKKIIHLLSLVTIVTLTSVQAQNATIYFETCGTAAVPAAPRISDMYTEGSYAGWDVGAPVTYNSSNNQSRLRLTGGTTNHIFFPKATDSDFIISNISAIGYKNLKLSFDVSADALPSDATAVSVFVNGTELTGIPSQPFSETNVIVNVTDIPIPYADEIQIKFAYTVSTSLSIYRLDNFKITGEDIYTGSISKLADLLEIQVAGNKLTIANPSVSTVDIFNTLGVKISTLKLVDGTAYLNLDRGIYIARSGKKSAKILL